MAALPSISQISGGQLDIYEGFFRLADPGGAGSVPASHAAAFLKQSALSDQILSTIWELSDTALQGSLDKQGFFIALKLISLVQSGHQPSVDKLALSTPPPKLGSLQPAPLPAKPDQSDTLRMHSPTPPAGLLPGEKEKYEQLFHSLKPENGKLSGPQVKPILLNSSLSTEMLGKIWELSDIDKDGCLDIDEFLLAMQFVYRCREKVPLPVSLPPSMIPPSKLPLSPGLAAIDRPTAPTRSSSLTPTPAGGGPAFFPGAVSVLPPLPSVGSMFPLKSVGGPVSPCSVSVSSGLTGPISPSPLSSAGPSQPDLIRTLSAVPSTPADSISLASHAASPSHVPSHPLPPAERQSYEANFRLLDTDNDGLVSGLDCKDVFLQSGLPQPLLAQIWGLCDIQNSGQLTLDQFLLAMHFVNQKRTVNIDPTHSFATEFLSRLSITPSASPSGGKSEFSKENEAIVREIEEIKNQKIELSGEKQQKEADLRIRTGELTSLQKDLDSVQATSQQLERQRGEAQKRLDELDDQNSKWDSDTKHLKEQWEEKQKSVNELREDMSQLSKTAWEQEEELGEVKKELETLAAEEKTVDQSLVTTNQLIAQILCNSEDASRDTPVLTRKLEEIEAKHALLKEALSQYAALLAGNSDAVEPTISLEEEEGGMFAAPVPSTSVNGFGDLFKKADPFSDDPFKKDVFTKSSDPFGGDDPFKAFSSGGGNSDPFGGSDPFKDTGSSDSKKLGTAATGSPFMSDAFSSNFKSSNKSSTGAAVGSSDPFDPFGGSQSSSNSGFGGSGTISQASKTEDLFASFAPPPSSTQSTTGKKKPPPRPAPPAKQNTVGTPTQSATPTDTNLFSDAAFGGADPFASSTGSGSKIGDAFGSMDLFAGSEVNTSSQNSRPNSSAKVTDAGAFDNLDPFADFGKAGTSSSNNFDAFAAFDNTPATSGSPAPGAVSSSAFGDSDPFASFGDTAKKDSSASTKKFDAFGGDSDLFGFGSKSKGKKKSVSGHTKDAFADFTTPPSKAESLAWAKEDSTRLEEERKKRLQEQEEADLEYALRLSKEQT